MSTIVVVRISNEAAEETRWLGGTTCDGGGAEEAWAGTDKEI